MPKIETYPAATALAGTEDLIGVQSAASVKTNPEQLRAYNISAKPQSYITKTLDIGGGGDWTTVAAMLVWLQDTEFKGAAVTITVQPGTYTWPADIEHFIKPDGLYDLAIYGTTEATCIFEFNYTGGNDYIFPLYFDSMFVRFNKLTWNNIGVEEYVFIANNTWMTISACTFNDFEGLGYIYGTNLRLSNVEFNANAGNFDAFISGNAASSIYVVGSVNANGNGGGWTAYDVEENSILEFSSTNSIDDYDMAIDTSKKSTVNIRGTLNLTNIASANFPYPLNEMQTDGSYISDGNLEVNLATKYRGQNLQTGTAYELVLGDAGMVLEMNNAAANVVTIPANSAVAFPVDTRIDVIQYGAGETTFTITTDTLTGNITVGGQYQMVSLWKRSAIEWVIIGGVV